VALENSYRIRLFPFGSERHITSDATEELKYDGFGALAYIDFGECQLVSRKGTVYRSFPKLCAATSAAIPAHAVLDGEIVHLDADGKPQFYELMRRRAPQHYYAFDLL
jgi:bifunctional non-homologous end joining protein LigD